MKAKILGCPDCVPERSVEPEQAWELQVSLLQLCTPAATSTPAPACVSQGPLGQWLWSHQVGGGRVPGLWQVFCGGCTPWGRAALPA